MLDTEGFEKLTNSLADLIKKQNGLFYESIKAIKDEKQKAFYVSLYQDALSGKKDLQQITKEVQQYIENANNSRHT